MARKPTSPKLIANTGTPVPAKSRRPVRIVPSPPSTMQRSTSRVVGLDELDPLAALEAVLAGLLGVEHERGAGAPRERDELAQRLGRVAVAAAVGLDDGPHLDLRDRHGVPTRCSAEPQERLAVAGRAASADGAKPRTAAPSARRADGRRSPRGALRVAHDAAAADVLAPDLELRLDHRQRVEALGRAGEHGREHLAQRDERDVDDDQVRRVGQLRRLQRARVDALDHGHPRVLAQRPVELAVGDVERDDVLRAAPAAGSR